MFRCAFWLSLVYASILLAPLHPGAGGRAVSLRQTGETALRHAASTGGVLLDVCALHQDTCVEQAARLTSLIDALATADRSASDGKAP